MFTAPCQTDTRITQLRARRVWDSRGRPTLEAEVTLADGSTGRAMARRTGVMVRARWRDLCFQAA